MFRYVQLCARCNLRYLSLFSSVPASWYLASIAMLPFKQGNVTMTIQRLLVTKKDLKALGIPYCPAHIARLEGKGLFPKRIKLGACRVAWQLQEVLNWIEERIANRDTAR
jgi:prophage regulatory protein